MQIINAPCVINKIKQKLNFALICEKRKRSQRDGIIIIFVITIGKGICSMTYKKFGSVQCCAGIQNLSYITDRTKNKQE